MESGLIGAIADYITAHGGPDAVSPTPVPGIVLICSTETRMPFRKIYKPSLCIVVQGAKRIELTDQIIDYAAGMALAVSIEMPGIGSITGATRAAPFMGMVMEFDNDILRNVLSRLEEPPCPAHDGLGAFVEHLSAQQQDCLMRLVRLFSTPDAVPVLYPAILQELYFWLLTGPNGGAIARIIQPDSHTRRIADAIYLLRKEYHRPIRVEEMADAARMSPSSFHQHFKALTAMTPLQYQKQLRLIEARRLMVTQASTVTRAAFDVGYESASQFSRDYTRLFGTAPKRDAMTLKSLAIPV
ncbi:AraC family transcriptional regulator [Fertoebacter nigrum]|uniref:AraC family transcriptional regulator n=1 Tax=Fertoeibacter niger TaxID=2656921 RepID=A0A8X8H3C5_9RHOB|nr:AraC family transcriptional regulator [Fertoeibacter niger]NUB45482.1 AraC family transcriptional regulator [Fertoeibacter niger]